MAEFWENEKICNFSELGLVEGKQLWLRDHGVVYTLRGGYERRGTVIPGPHWSGVWTATYGVETLGTLVLKPRSGPARAWIRDRTIETMEGLGLTRAQANRWLHGNWPCKYELAERLGQGLNSLELFEAMMTRRGMLRHEWWGTLSITQKAFFSGLSSSRVDALCMIAEGVVIR